MNGLDATLLIVGYAAIGVLAGAVSVACDENLPMFAVPILIAFWPLVGAMIVVVGTVALLSLLAVTLGETLIVAFRKCGLK